MRRWLMLTGVMWATAAMAQQDRQERILVVPVEKAVMIDGDLKDWDLSGAIDTALDARLRPLFTVQIALMYDAEALYIGAHFADDTPMLNRHDPRVEAANGWAGDCLQIHLCSDADQPYPLPVKIEADTVCDLILWNYTDRKEPVLFTAINWGKSSRLYTGADSGLAFREDADGKGYVLEARVPWSRLNAPRLPKAGDRIAFLAKPFWGDATGTKHAAFFTDVICRAGFAASDSGMWGRAEFLEKGNLAASAKPKTAAELKLPVKTTLTLPDKKATTVSAAIYNASNVMVRTLLAGATAEPMDQPLYGARIVKRDGANVDVAWDGCDDLGKPLPAGDYSVKLLTSRGIGQKWVASVHNAGNPPWFTDDDTGSWGGDHAPPIGVAADGERVYLLWAMSECGPAMIACRPDGQKLWGARSFSMEAGWGFQAVAADGEYVYVLQDGYKYDQLNWQDMSQPRTCVPAIVRFEAATGKPANFPFGKRCLMVGDWSEQLLPPFGFRFVAFNEDSGSFPMEGAPYRRLWEKLETHDFGPHELGRNALGLAVHGNTAYVTKYLENKVQAFDIETGNLVRDWNVERPVGLAASADGTLYATAGKGIVRLLENGAVATVVKEALVAPWGLAVGKDGLLYASDCGDAMQVRVFNRQGECVRTIGKKGGRPWIGKYDENGMLEPAGLGFGPDGTLWVTEYDLSPLRISTWQPRKGTFVKEYFGPGSYAVTSSVDDERPHLVCVHNTIFDVNYRTGTTKPLGTFQRNVRGRQFKPHSFRYQFRHVQGRTYACSMDIGGSVVFLVKDEDGVPVAEPVAAWGVLDHLQYNNLTSADIPAKARKECWPDRGKIMYQWHDLNGDRMIQDDEWTFTRVDQTKVKAAWRNYWGNWPDEKLGFWTVSYNNQIVTFSVKEWRGDVPIYASFSEVEPRFSLGDAGCDMLIQDEEALYFTRAGSVFSDKMRKGAQEKRRLNGEIVWSYARAYAGLNAPLPVLGDMPCAALRNVARTASGLGLLFYNAYYGQYFLLDTDGLYVGALCKDSRTGPNCGPDTILMENFNGHFIRNNDNGKYYAFGGDTDARIWEVTGIDTLKKGTMPLTIRPEDASDSAALLRQGYAGQGGQPPLRVGKAVPGGFDKLTESLKAGDIVTWDAGAGRSAKVALAHDGTNLYALYKVADTSPMANAGKEWETLFKSGDTCEIMIAADPQADPQREQPVAGDMRVLFSAMEGQPVAVMYEAVARPGEEKAARSFNSPARGFHFDRVVQLTNAVVRVDRTAEGYVLVATVPLKDLGLVATAGLKTKGDVGVLFSNDGGTVTARRTYYFNQNTSITGDLPSEAQLQPADWGTVEVDPGEGGE
ncbi:MAG: hypothetical protein PHR35_03350 [Kiritimatiellae bacterium]|nr:hypothetical protein [Kiritimatiellia bacterium]